MICLQVRLNSGWGRFYCQLVIFQNMGNKLTQEEQTLSSSLQQQYFFQSNRYLVHKATQRPCTLHRIQTYSKQQAASVGRNIDLYNQSNCNSISKLREHFQLDNSGYCSDQEKFYLVFDGHNSPNIKEEYFSRRYAGQGFMYQEIEAILSCMLCSLRHYYQVFNRKESRISLQSVCIDRSKNNTLWLKDPWLLQKQSDSNQLPINFLATYPSPQKIQASNQAYFDYSQFRSDLFSVGIFGLQFLNMNFRDDLYAHKKFVDRQRVNESLNAIQNGRLRGGLGILLSEDPEMRYKIYQYWDILCTKIYRINSSYANNLQVANTQIKNTPYLQNLNVHPYNPQPSPRFIMTPTLQQSQASTHFPNNYYPMPQSKVPNYNVGRQTPIMSQHSSSSSNIEIPSRQLNYISNPSNQQPIMNNSNLTKQFNKPLFMKKGIMNENGRQPPSVNTFKKRQKLQPLDMFDSQIHKPQTQNQLQNQLRNQNKIQFQVRPQSHRPANSPSLSPPPIRSMSPSNQLIKPTKNQSPIKFTTSNPTTINPQPPFYYQQTNLKNSLETPKFNYQSPAFNNDFRSSTSSHGYMQGSLQGSQGVLNSFKLHGSTQQQHQNIYFNQHNSPGPSGNSPILTKSIINSVQQYPNTGPFNANLPKMSSEQNTQTFSNNQSLRQTLRQTKNISETQRNSMSPGTSPLINISRQKSEQVYQRNYLNDKSTEKQSSFGTKSNPIQILQNAIKNQEVAIPKHIPSSPEHNAQERYPTSPSTIQVTPPPAIRHPNKYNSTIVEVNQQTPNESSDSETENNGDIEFLVEQYETGSRYQGFKKNGLRHGRGKFFYQDGGYYDGQWKKNQMHGWGKLFYQGGQLAYEGNWAHDEFHGYGKVYNDNPVPLQGVFDYTNFDLLDDYWQFYQGMLANDTKQGRGRIQLTNKEIFQGDFHADRIQGFGKFLRRDGTIVQGIWRDSRLIKILNSSDIYK